MIKTSVLVLHRTLCEFIQTEDTDRSITYRDIFMIVIFPKICGYYQGIYILEFLLKMVDIIINDFPKADI